MNKIVCITGLPGAGKSLVSDYFVNKGCLYVRFGQITLDEIKKRKLLVNEANERKIREEFRKKYGMAAFAILNLKKFDELILMGNVVADGIYSFEEYKVLKEHFKDRFELICVYAPPKMRYQRLVDRKPKGNDINARDRSLSVKEAISRDMAEIEKLNKGGTMAMADHMILNTKTLASLRRQVKEVYVEIFKN